MCCVSASWQHTSLVPVDEVSSVQGLKEDVDAFN